MATIVCKGLQSCLEPQVIESLVVSETLVLVPQPDIQETKNVEKKKNGWSFLKVLDNQTKMDSKNNDNFDHQNDVVYVHPMTKRNASALSTKSLEMCTESLGSETGSESGDEFCVLSVEERERLRSIHRSKYNRNFDRKVRRSEFPPPLTSISGSDGSVKVRHHREGGRLVIKAVSVSNCETNFQTERINGRLKLSLLRDCFENNESGRVESENYEKGGEVESESEYEVVDEDEKEEENDNDDDVAVADDEVEDGGCGGEWRWDMDGNRWRIAGKGKLKMVTRCKEGGNGNKVLTNWASSWVAIS
uniref:protein FANTASTIC FOUR 1-like n=1 Tax=Erigeron canadensis TaxID=72917 RepID=UPI001CB90874|nr:protein FANTASTIC FOUR 1-like [Erigeron canadensis]